MAKLSNVKTVDMVNGEITKVAYDGAEYAKVANDFKDAQTGDLFLNTENGGFYEITIGASDFYGVPHPVRFVNDKGRETGYMRECNVHPLFRKISDTSPTIEERVSSLESDVAALKSDGKSDEPKRLTAGDSVKILGLSRFGKDYIGQIGVVTRDIPDCDGDISVKVDDYTICILPSKVELASQANETIEFEGETYRKVEREAREGDVIISTVEHSSMVNVGKPYKVGGGLHVIAEGDYKPTVYNAGRNRKNVDVYELSESPKYVPQEGDIVVVTANTTLSANSIGDIGKVGNEEPLCDGGVNVYVPGGSTDGIRTKPCDIRKATPAEVEQYEKALHKASFAVGDYVKLVKSERNNVGAIAKVIGVGSFSTRHVDGSTSKQPFKIKHISGKMVGEITTGSTEILVKATEAEVAEALKPKLKAGDFVKIIDRDFYDLTNGKLYEIGIDEEGDAYILSDDDGDETYAISDEDVKYEIVDAETAKWAKIGREVNEYRVGDVAKVVEYNCGHKVGTIVEITKLADVDGHFRAKALGDNYAYGPNRLELVAPVESLFTTQN